MNACRSCKAPVLWTRTAAGKAMPLDPEPNPAGNVVLVKGVAVVLGKRAAEGVAAVEGTRYMPHWATCPNAKEHKR